MPALTLASEGAVHPSRSSRIDDDADFREYIRTVLEGDGHRVGTFASPSGSCYASFDDSLPDVLLLDMNMGRYSGSEVLAEVRRRWPRLCVIVITGYPSLDTMRQTFAKTSSTTSPSLFTRRLTQDAPASRRHAAPGPIGTRSPPGRAGPSGSPRPHGQVMDAQGPERVLGDKREPALVDRARAHLPSLESLVRIADALDERPSRWLIAAGLWRHRATRWIASHFRFPLYRLSLCLCHLDTLPPDTSYPVSTCPTSPAISPHEHRLWSAPGMLAAEASGDDHAAGVVAELRARRRTCRFSHGAGQRWSGPVRPWSSARATTRSWACRALPRFASTSAHQRPHRRVAAGQPGRGSCAG